MGDGRPTSHPMEGPIGLFSAGGESRWADWRLEAWGFPARGEGVFGVLGLLLADFCDEIMS